MTMVLRRLAYNLHEQAERKATQSPILGFGQKIIEKKKNKPNDKLSSIILTHFVILKCTILSDMHAMFKKCFLKGKKREKGKRYWLVDGDDRVVVSDNLSHIFHALCKI